ncbi:MAG: MCE family protein [Bacteroidales bacterium]|nr:MCE family protein [Bacteroidales bacterium]
MQNKKEFVIGFVAILTLLLVYWGFNFLKGEDIFSKDRKFVIVYNKISGLNVSNPVVINGFKIGRVSKLSFQENDPNAHIIVEIQIKSDIAIPKNSIARINSDFLGVNTIDISLGDGVVMSESGDTLAGIIATSLQEEFSQQLLPFKVKAEKMMASMDSVLEGFRYIFNRETQDNLGNAIKSIYVTFDNLEAASKEMSLMMAEERTRLREVMDNAKEITDNLAKNSKEIDNILNNFSSISDSLAKVDFAKTMRSVDGALVSFTTITDKINRGEGTLGQLVHNDTLYYELESASRELNELLEDMKLHPNRYVKVSVFGGKNKDPYIKPEDENDKKK